MAGATIADLNSLYGSLLGRAPDQSGIGTYTGQDINQVRQSILTSPEYAQRQQSLANAPLDFAKQQSADFNALLDRQKNEQQGLFNQYTQKIGSQEQLPALYQRLQSEQGIGEITQQLQPYKDEIYRVKGLLDRLDENVNSRNIGTYATQALRDRIAASEGQDLRTDLSRLGTGMEPLTERLTAAQGQVAALLPLYVQQQARELQPLEMQINGLSDRFAREISGYNTNRETELTALMSKLQRENDLSDREWELAQQIASEERQYAHQKSLAASTLSNYLQPAQQNQPQQPAQQQPVRPLPSLPAGAVQLAPGYGVPVVPPSQTYPKTTNPDLFAAANVYDPLGLTKGKK